MKIVIQPFLLALLLQYSITAQVYAAELSVLLINSNASVEKYRNAESGFVERYKGKVMRMDLGEQQRWTPKRIKKFLYDEYPDLIYAVGAKAYLVASRWIGEKPIIFSSVVNWKRLPEATERHAISNELHGGMQLSLIRQLFPELEQVGMLYSQRYTADLAQEVVDNGEITGHKVALLALSGTESEAERADKLATLLQKVDLLLFPSDPVLMEQESAIRQILELASVSGIPVVGYFEQLAEQGGAFSITVDAPTVGRQAAGVVKQWQQQQQVSKQIYYPAGSSLTVNRQVLHAIGGHYNPDALFMVNRVIE